MDIVNQKYLDIFAEVEEKYNQLSEFLMSVEVMADNKLYLYYLKQQKQIADIAMGFKEYKKNSAEIQTNNDLINIEKDESLVQSLRAENEELEKLNNELLNRLKSLCFEKGKVQSQKVKIEISSKTKADFVLGLINKYAEVNGLKIEVLKQAADSILCCVVGNNIYKDLFVLCGIVKIIENTQEHEARVVVLEEQIAPQEILEDEIEVSTLKSGGAGGQHINKTESAVRLVHIATGISVICQDERSQTKNKERAMQNLKEKILQYYAKNNEKYIKNQRNQIKNAIFSSTAALIFNFDTHMLTVTKLKKDYALQDILGGNLQVIANDLEI